MSDDAWGFADINSMDAKSDQGGGELADVTGDDWRNILVLGRATKDGVYPETLALVGRARYLADELGCRVEVLLIGNDLDAATEVLQKYPINTVYRVACDDYAPIDTTANILEAVVKKRRPELVMAFQSRTGDAVAAYAASRLGVGFVQGALSVDIDTYERRARATHVAGNSGFQISTEFQVQPQFVTVQRGLFRAPMEDPYASVQVHDLDITVARTEIRVAQRDDPPVATLAEAETVVLAGVMVRDQADVDAARALAKRLGAAFGVTRGNVERGLGSEDEMVDIHGVHIKPRLLLTVGVRGGLATMEGIQGNPTICAIGAHSTDPIAKRCAYLVPGTVAEALEQVEGGL